MMQKYTADKYMKTDMWSEGFQWAVYQYLDWKTSTENDLRNPPKAGCHQSRGPQGREVGGVGWLVWSGRFNRRDGIWVVPWKEGRVWLRRTILWEHPDTREEKEAKAEREERVGARGDRWGIFPSFPGRRPGLSVYEGQQATGDPWVSFLKWLWLITPHEYLLSPSLRPGRIEIHLISMFKLRADYTQFPLGFN